MFIFPSRPLTLLFPSFLPSPRYLSYSFLLLPSLSFFTSPRFALEPGDLLSSHSSSVLPLSISPPTIRPHLQLFPSLPLLLSLPSHPKLRPLSRSYYKPSNSIPLGSPRRSLHTVVHRNGHHIQKEKQWWLDLTHRVLVSKTRLWENGAASWRWTKANV